jgi:hypothetical protein
MDTPIYVKGQKVRVLHTDFYEIPVGSIATIQEVDSYSGGVDLECASCPAGLYFRLGEIEPLPQDPPATTQGVKFDTEKPKWSLVPKGVMQQVVEVLTYGSKKYTPDNWMYVEKSRYYDALLRHVDAFHNGEKVDAESGKHHLAHALCCLMYMLWHDDNPTPKATQ